MRSVGHIQYRSDEDFPTLYSPYLQQSMDIIHFPRCHRFMCKNPHSYPYPSREGITIRRPSPRASHNGSSEPVICKRKWSMFWYHGPLGLDEMIEEKVRGFKAIVILWYALWLLPSGRTTTTVFDAGWKWAESTVRREKSKYRRPHSFWRTVAVRIQLSVRHQSIEIDYER